MTEPERYRHEPSVESAEYYGDCANPPELHDRIADGFANARKRGLVTIEGDICCGTCAGHEATRHASQLAEQGHDVNGYVAVHIQSLERSVDNLYLWYSDVEAGHIAVDAFEEAGCAVEWSGDISETIHVASHAEIIEVND